ncbi:d-2-hydroxyglutarate dehydrogenase (plasmid) [Methylorubrum extorquens DM4]|uniref:D-2-hydroxyglutarate dehydrogenase n=1 Tax=Methylorubrum extorquens (strain DSM 6343 / CIP 106787 / DM4) TaxID=661410 RepID=C7CMZ0_METED|nr:FAD-binding oxidoreductase [Methylorubrum extorquens]CAX17019.1 d-2-hydroxyglutarate dehydrogenase [Methylorubrum extorquens DM4]
MAAASISSDLLERLREALGPGGVLTTEDDLAPHALDWRRLFPGKPAAVLRPSSTREVAAAVALCRDAGVAIVPQGGHTGLAGGATPDGSGSQIVLALGRMNAIRAIDPVGLTLEAEAGCIVQNVQAAAEAANRLFPVSFAAEGSAMIGGMIATNAGGINVLRYGMTRNLVLGLEVVLADGTVVDGLRALRKDNAGYDWKQLFIGSEGTLGIVTAAVLRLAPRPLHTATAFLAVDDPEAALRVLRAAQDELGDTIQAFELISGTSLRLVARHAGLKSPIADAPWTILIEAGSSLSGLRDAVETMLGAVLERGDARDGVLAESQAQAGKLWALRERITESEALEGRSIKHDVSVPIPAIPTFLEAADRALAGGAPGAVANVFGHMGDGNIHYNVVVQPEQDGAAINRLVHEVVGRLGGSISAEHGIGQYRVDELVAHRRPEEIALAKRIKRAMDPNGLLNPGKVLRGGWLLRGNPAK